MNMTCENQLASRRASQATPSEQGNISTTHAFCRNAIIVTGSLSGAMLARRLAVIIGPFGKTAMEIGKIMREAGGIALPIRVRPEILVLLMR
jgi:hypothetical protein